MIDNKLFCMYPWVHIHTTPSGNAKPCCISDPEFEIGNSNSSSLMELVNSEKMNKLRLDMMAGKRIPACEICYHQERHSPGSGRTQVNKSFLKYYDDLVPHTNPDGSLTEFKMKYFDIRFNNICNMKCRTCNAEYSSQWEMEDKKSGREFIRIIKNNNKDFLSEVIDQIPNIDSAYFAGGEPLITEEHYIMLEEMIRQGRTDISLTYNTNLSNLKYKDRDLLSLWSKFTNSIIINASIDHYGKRAEYIRHGTVWADIEDNYNKLLKNSNIKIGINTVLSLFNILTLDDFYQYTIGEKMYRRGYNYHALYKMDSPEYLTALILPAKHKEDAVGRIRVLIGKLRRMGFGYQMLNELGTIINWLGSKDDWENQKELFKQEISRLDGIRNENFANTFPELAELLDL